MIQPVHVVGGGLAGSEAAWQLAEAGVPVVLHEMRPVRGTDAHQTDQMAELVCSNSFRSDDAEYNAVGLLHEEMRRCGSLILRSGDGAKLPAGGALAVDRDDFAGAVTAALEAHPLVTIERGEVAGLPPEDWDSVILATGPLTSPALAEAIRELTGETALSFFDAIAPIVYKESIDFSRAWFQSRYDKVGPGGTGKDYINCPFEKDEYLAFIQALLDGEKTEFKEWEKDTPYFEGCLPIEVMASRGIDTLRFGPMKPVGLTDPNSNRRPYAVLQLRQDNALGTLYNLVGFQTKLKYAEQTRVFRMIPGLQNAEFARLGGLHRNTFLNSPKLLDGVLRLKDLPRLRFAGQVTGVEGYVESAAIGLLAGRFAAAERLGRDIAPPPPTTALGALLGHITGGADAETFQPMNVNFGLFPEPEQDPDPKKRIKGRERKKLYTGRALADLDGWLGGTRLAAE
ncbi:methylenetetrahydrofolate--tRNA-(uracil(54)-C(5))-methyltransferase (FADH(2)-oxidizing) TrmFO [Oceanibaculum nanhaiense]|jgi:methylenetetrahydrofolate--tRNA-(uracil-5-)-methyltransferase|uniref:methylenetetrahydrofolate--tRNA-(uracil(54)- C(5))-methyltransferase (FADH(2)-oxidizing) TrmFO n=1 Tax=Oceanibaculum nanhaiense TaxID=1909734 RepID=UPI000A3C5DB8|nr:methylenetetrahydrofolate--tRNA-(uracil(54)-C(5))-methyltransferase (FADH(2)-oxidizing) TrmFO [Oceanibaculum nanhaiense]MBC7134718.1 methylenetetrahydrofolate--tRNA-(uracil(54)-C(5))-methyltransferase (FADH(2)-oxidizing) TrmFO [Oceanibaculum nanhaiense]